MDVEETAAVLEKCTEEVVIELVADDLGIAPVPVVDAEEFKELLELVERLEELPVALVLDCVFAAGAARYKLSSQ